MKHSQQLKSCSRHDDGHGCAFDGAFAWIVDTRLSLNSCRDRRWAARTAHDSCPALLDWTGSICLERIRDQMSNGTNRRLWRAANKLQASLFLWLFYFKSEEREKLKETKIFRCCWWFNKNKLFVESFKEGRKKTNYKIKNLDPKC